MNVLEPIAAILLVTVTVAYLHAVVKLHKIIAIERPEWVDRKGSLSFFYTGMPRIADPNVSLAVLGVAFSSRSTQLGASATPYVHRIRVLLPILLLFYVGVIVVTSVRTP